MARLKDALDELIEDSEREHPGFKRLVDYARQRREFARKLVAQREKLGMSQTEVATEMKSTQAVVSRIENGGDARLSTIQKYADAIGFGLEWKLKRRGS